MTKMNYSYNLRLLIAYGKSLGLLLGIALVLSIPMMLLWNWLMPFIFGLPKLTILQTLGLSLLINMITSKPQYNTETSKASMTVDGMKEYNNYIKMRDEIEKSWDR